MVTIPTIILSILTGLGAEVLGTMGAGSIFTTLFRLFAKSAGTAAGKAAIGAATGHGRQPHPGHDPRHPGQPGPHHIPPHAFHNSAIVPVPQPQPHPQPQPAAPAHQATANDLIH